MISLPLNAGRRQDKGSFRFEAPLLILLGLTGHGVSRGATPLRMRKILRPKSAKQNQHGQGVPAVFLKPTQLFGKLFAHFSYSVCFAE